MVYNVATSFVSDLMERDSLIIGKRYLFMIYCAIVRKLNISQFRIHRHRLMRDVKTPFALPMWPLVSIFMDVPVSDATYTIFASSHTYTK